MFKISKSMLCLLVFTIVASLLTWKIVQTAYSSYDYEVYAEEY